MGQLFIPFIQEVYHFPVSFSDHCGVHVELNLPNFDKPVPPPRHRSPYWKLNNSILSDSDFLPNFNKVWDLALVTKQNYPNVLSWWEKDAKPQITTFCQKYSVTIARERRDTKQFLFYCLTRFLNEGKFEEALKMKQKINKILMAESMGFVVRSRFQENAEMERASLYHVNREKKRGKGSNLEKLMINNSEEDNRDKIEEAVLQFFGRMLHQWSQ